MSCLKKIITIDNHTRVIKPFYVLFVRHYSSNELRNSVKSNSLHFIFAKLIILLPLLLFLYSCQSAKYKNTDEYVNVNASPKNYQFKIIKTDVSNPRRLATLKAIKDTANWLSFDKAKEADLKRGNGYILKYSFDAGRWKNPALLFSGRIDKNLAIYKDTVMIFSAENNVSSPQHIANKIIDIQSNAKTNIYFAAYYRKVFDQPIVNIHRVGEKSALLDGIGLSKMQNNKFITSVLLGAVFITLGLLAFLAVFVYNRHSHNRLIFFALFALSIGFLNTMNGFQFFFNVKPTYYNLLLYFFEAIIPFSFVGFIKHSFPIKNRKLISFVFYLNLVYCLIMPFLMLQFWENTFYWIILGVTSLLLFFIFLKEKLYKQNEFRYPLLGLGALFIVLFINILHILNGSFFYIDINFGVLAFIVGLSIFTVMSLNRQNLEAQETNIKLQQAENNLLQLENKNIQSQFEVLKAQINPHFLFNSLNTLASLINFDKEKSVRYVEEFSALYRRLLDKSDETLLFLRDEMQFLDSYIYLQKIRFGENLQFNIDIKESDLGKGVPPLSVQMLVENALKHNEVSEDFPLEITIYTSENYLVVSNPLQLKTLNHVREGIGIENLKQRYATLTTLEVITDVSDRFFTIKIPLIEGTMI